MAVCAAIDIGTNSLKLHVAELLGGRSRELLDRVEVTRLGEDLYRSGRLSAAAMARNVEAVARFAAQARVLGAAEILAAGTMALRIAENAAEFIAAIEEACALRVAVLSGEEEARLTWLGVASELASLQGRCAVLDSGGGSTEFILGEGRALLARHSLPVGSRQATERFLHTDPVAARDLARLRASLRRDFAALVLSAEQLLGVGGTVTTLASVERGLDTYEPRAVGGTRLSRAALERQIRLYSGKALAARRRIPGLPADRADVILGGAVIVAAALDRLGLDCLIVSDRGLRHGLICDRCAAGDPA